MDILRKLSSLFTAAEKWKIAGLLVLMTIGAALETAGIGLILPFISLVSDPESISRRPGISSLYQAASTWGMDTHGRFLLLVSVGLMLFYVLKSSYLFLLVHIQNKFAFGKEVQLSRSLLAAYMSQPYGFHLQKNSAVLINNLSNVSRLFSGVVVPIFNILIEAIIFTSVTILLLVMRPVAALAAIGVLGSCTILFYAYVRKKLRAKGEEQQLHSAAAIQWMNQSLGGVKETKVLGRESFFVSAYEESVRGYTDSTRFIQTVGQAPRMFIETIGLCGIVLVVCFAIWRGMDLSSLIPTLGLFGLAAVRLMPSLNRIVSNLTVIRYCHPAVDIVHGDLQALRHLQPPDGLAKAEAPLHFKDKIELKRVSYSYPGASCPALRDLSISVGRGQSVAFVGPSGSGKTTLVDIVLGLLEPEAGGVFVDGSDIRSNLPAWRSMIGYIPQSIFLSDDSIRGNIAFGVPRAEVDDQKVWSALRAAQLEDFIRTRPEGLETFVGERGVRLSGGQRQRIGIARALYHNPAVLILDEATSALDQETESEVTRAIESLAGEKTILVIAHRLATAKKCDRIFKIAGGEMVASGSFAEVCGEA